MFFLLCSSFSKFSTKGFYQFKSILKTASELSLLTCFEVQGLIFTSQRAGCKTTSNRNFQRVIAFLIFHRLLSFVLIFHLPRLYSVVVNIVLKF